MRKLYGPYPEFDRAELNTALDVADAPRAIAALRKVDFLDELYGMPCYVEEGYDTSEHAQAVFNLHTELTPDITSREARLFMLLHDIGKPIIRRAMERDKLTRPDEYSQFEYKPQEYISIDVADQLWCEGIISKDERRYIDRTIFVNHMSTMMFGETAGTIWEDDRRVIEQIRNGGYSQGIPAGDYYRNIRSYWLADSGSYTTRGWYVSTKTGEKTQCIQLYDCIYDFDQPPTGPLKMVFAAAARLARLDDCAQRAAAMPDLHDEITAMMEAQYTREQQEYVQRQAQAKASQQEPVHA